MMKMSDTINGKTPEEIKKGLEEEIPVHYHLPNPEPRLHPTELMQLQKLHGSDLTYIQQLESRLAQAERERDALYFDIANMPNACDVCVHGVQYDGDCDELFWHNNGCEFKWRGVCPANTKEEE